MLMSIFMERRPYTFIWFSKGSMCQRCEQTAKWTLVCVKAWPMKRSTGEVHSLLNNCPSCWNNGPSCRRWEFSSQLRQQKFPFRRWHVEWWDGRWVSCLFFINSLGIISLHWLLSLLTWETWTEVWVPLSSEVTWGQEEIIWVMCHFQGQSSLRVLKLLLGSLHVHLVVTSGLAGSQGHNSPRSGHTWSARWVPHRRRGSLAGRGRKRARPPGWR